MADLIFRKSGGWLVPAEDPAVEWLRRRKDGAAVVMSPVQVVNAERRALFHVLCGIVAENHEELKTKDAVDEVVRHLTGHFEVVAWTPPNGKRMFIQRAKTVSYALPEDEFEAFFTRALEVIQSQLLPGVDIDELKKEAYLRSGYTRKPNRKKIG